MAYPQYEIKFQNTPESKAKVTKAGGGSGPIGTDGSHTFVLTVNGTSVNVDLTHVSNEDRTPKLILTFK